MSERLARARTLVWIGNIAGLLAMPLLQFGPIWWDVKIDLTIALCLPIAALLAAVLFRGLVTLTSLNTANDARPSLVPMIVFPSMAVLTRLLLQANVRDWTPLVLPAVAGGALGAALTMLLDAKLRNRMGAALGNFVYMTLFARAVIGWLDVRIDPYVVQPVRVAVTGHSTAKGPIWRIHLGAAPTGDDWRTVSVSRQKFLDLQIGQVACLSEHPGLFGMRWAELHRCPGDAQPTTAEAAHRWLAAIARPAS